MRSIRGTGSHPADLPSAHRCPSRRRARQPPGLEHNAAATPAGCRTGHGLVAGGRLSARETDPRDTLQAILGPNDLVGQPEAPDQINFIHLSNVELTGRQLRQPLAASLSAASGAGPNAIGGEGIGNDARSLASATDPPHCSRLRVVCFLSRRSLPRTASHTRRRITDKLAQPTLLIVV